MCHCINAIAIICLCHVRKHVRGWSIATTTKNNNFPFQCLPAHDMHLFFLWLYFQCHCLLFRDKQNFVPVSMVIKLWTTKKRLSRSFSFQFSWKSHALKTCVCIYFLSPPSCLCKKLRNLAIFKIDLFSHAQKVVKRKSESEVKTRTWSRKLFKFSFWSPSFPP